MKKIAPFTLREPDICVKCGEDMPVGTEVTWLRDADAKGYYHIDCEDLPTIDALRKVKVAAADSPLGFVYMRKGAIPAGAVLGEAEPATQLTPSHNPEPKAEVEALVEALLPRLREALAQPRIVVNVYVPKSGDEVKALDLLSKELFLLDRVQTI